MPEIIDWQRAEPRAAVQRAVEVLCTGKMVVFPTETCYEIGVCLPQSGEEASLPGVLGSSPTLVLNHPLETLDWVPDLGKLGLRLARRFWPGPVILRSGAGRERGLASRLPAPVRQRLCPDSCLAFRVPEHPAVRMACLQLPAPLALASPTVPATTAAQLVDQLGNEVALVIDDGPTRYSQAPAVVRVEGNCWDLVQSGPLSRGDVERMASIRILFICTGNTCRSPMAQALCQKLLADQLGCSPAELPDRGFVVESAGLAAYAGCEPCPEAVAVVREHGADLVGHRSRFLTMNMVAQADFLFAMTHSHLLSLDSFACFGLCSPRLLSPRGEDLPDPIGGDMEVYRKCAQTIWQDLQDILPELSRP